MTHVHSGEPAVVHKLEIIIGKESAGEVIFSVIMDETIAYGSETHLITLNTPYLCSDTNFYTFKLTYKLGSYLNRSSYEFDIVLDLKERISATILQSLYNEDANGVMVYTHWKNMPLAFLVMRKIQAWERRGGLAYACSKSQALRSLNSTLLKEIGFYL